MTTLYLGNENWDEVFEIEATDEVKKLLKFLDKECVFGGETGLELYEAKDFTNEVKNNYKTFVKYHSTNK